MNLLSVLYMALYLISGAVLSRVVFQRESRLVRLMFSLVFGELMLLWLPALWSFLLGFCVLSQLLAASTAAATAGFVGLLNRNIFKVKLSSEKDRASLPVLFCFLALIAAGTILFCTHTIVNIDGSLWVGQSTYGDLSMHLGFITSISEQKAFPPVYSICPDTQIGYPFLSDSISSTFYTLGSSLRFAAILPEVLAFSMVVIGVYLFFLQWFKKKGSALLGALLFLLGGGFGFAYFLDLAQFQPDRFSSLFTAFYETPTNFPDLGLRWVNAICDMLIPQRATLFGWSLLFPCLCLLHKTVSDHELRYFPVLGVIAGLLPLVHTHSFLALGVISLFYLLYECLTERNKKQIVGLLIYGITAVVIAAPQLILFTFRQSGSFLKINLNWDNVSDSFLWFYIKNWGLLFLLLPPAIFTAKKDHRLFFFGSCLLWAIAEIVQFQPNPYDNNKLLFVVYAYICGIIADFLWNGFIRLKEAFAGHRAKTAGLYYVTALLTVCLFLSGTLTLIREFNSSYMLIESGEVRASEFIKDHTAADATFLTSNNHNNAVAVLTGRNIVCGSGSFLFYHGVEYQDREQSLRPMFEEPGENENLFDTYEVDYIYIGPYERSNYSCDLGYFSEHFELVYSTSSVRIYKRTDTAS